jgi:RNA polymerase sigma factor (sigma-70 family)
LGELVDRASRGDAAAIDELLTTHLPALRAFVRLRMGPTLRARESSCDLVQSICREILENAERYRFRGEDNFKRWLFTTALRVVKNRAKYWQREKRAARREASRRPPDSIGTHASFSDCYRSLITPSREALAREEVERFERAFETLSEEHREVISLARIVGLSHAEIAKQMNRSEAAAKQLLYRALTALSLALRPGGAITRRGGAAGPP